MKAVGGLYPSLGQLFKSQSELAHAGCMSVRRLYDCLNGIKTFTRAEKKAISANIIAKELDKRPINEKKIADAQEAYRGRFDEIYRRKVG